MKTIIHKHFSKNINVILKKKKPKIYITGDSEISFDEYEKELSDKESFNRQTAVTLLTN